MNNDTPKMSSSEVKARIKELQQIKRDYLVKAGTTTRLFDTTDEKKNKELMDINIREIDAEIDELKTELNSGPIILSPKEHPLIVLAAMAGILTLGLYIYIEFIQTKEPTLKYEIVADDQSTAIGKVGGDYVAGDKIVNNEEYTLQDLDTSELIDFLKSQDPVQFERMEVPDLFSMQLLDKLKEGGWTFKTVSSQVAIPDLPARAKIEIYYTGPPESVIFLNDWLNDNGFDSELITEYVRNLNRSIIFN